MVGPPSWTRVLCGARSSLMEALFGGLTLEHPGYDTTTDCLMVYCILL